MSPSRTTATSVCNICDLLAFVPVTSSRILLTYHRHILYSKFIQNKFTLDRVREEEKENKFMC